MERTFAIVKPDGFERNLTEEIIKRYETEGLKVVQKKEILIDKELAAELYKEHLGKWYYDRNVNYIASDIAVLLVLEGEDCIQKVRRINGPTDPETAPKGTIRGDFGINLPKNTVHASDSVESAKREISIFFQ